MQPAVFLREAAYLRPEGADEMHRIGVFHPLADEAEFGDADQPACLPDAHMPLTLVNRALMELGCSIRCSARSARDRFRA